MAGAVRRVRGVAVLLAGVLVLASCGSDGDSQGKSGDKPSSPSPSVTVPVADPDHAVDPPPPFKGALVPADILVYDDVALDEDVVKRIRRLKGVSRVAQLSLANTSLQNQVFTLGAVDPASYRHFSTAGKQDEIWARVAGGEMALPQAVADQIQQDDAFVQLGSDADAPKVHIGAYAPQAGGVDMVVNEKWAEDLFRVRDNALLIYTGKAAPSSLRKPISTVLNDRGFDDRGFDDDRGLDGKVSIQMLDAVARYGLDPDAVQTAVPTGGSVSSAVGVFSYRVVGGRVIPSSSWIAENIRTEVVPILGRITCHKVMLPQLRGALTEIQQLGLASKVYQTAGCYYPRFIANTTRLSNHAFGLAIDINSRENQRGTVGQMDREVVRIFKNWGFAWGGDWSWTDPMHFELARIVEAR
jgi:hypothetical protein